MGSLKRFWYFLYPVEPVLTVAPSSDISAILMSFDQACVGWEWDKRIQDETEFWIMFHKSGILVRIVPCSPREPIAAKDGNKGFQVSLENPPRPFKLSPSDQQHLYTLFKHLRSEKLAVQDQRIDRQLEQYTINIKYLLNPLERPGRGITE